MRNKPSFYVIFLLINALLCIFYILVFRPVVIEANGDASSYIGLAGQIFNFPDAPAIDLSHRSPLYSILLGFAMLIFGQNNFLEPVVILQYFIVFLTSLLIYRVFKILTGNIKIAFISGILSTINLSTVFYAYNILSEILALFMFTWLVYQVLLYYRYARSVNLALAGLLAGFLVLVRFNTLGIPFVLLGSVILIHLFNNGIKLIKKLFSEITIVLFCSLLVLNLWAFYNYQSKGTYMIFPTNHMGQRWAIPSTIDKNDIVSEQNKEILAIFLKAREKVEIEVKSIKSYDESLLKYATIKKINDYFQPSISGFLLYTAAEPDLLKYFKLEDVSGKISILGKKLQPFYKEIAFQNKKELLKLKFYSFFYTFKNNPIILPTHKSINLNVLPSGIVLLYKICFLLITVFVFFASLVHLRVLIRSKEIHIRSNFIILYSLIWYFPVVNFYANVLDDANRFKFPAESIILGLGIFYFYNTYLYLKNIIFSVNH